MTMYDNNPMVDDLDELSTQDDVATRENTGRWTAEEHRKFEEGLRKYGKQWKKIAATIPSRTVVQIRTHAQKYFLRLAKSGNAVSSSIAGKPKVTMAQTPSLHKKVLEQQHLSAKRKASALSPSENVSPNGNRPKPMAPGANPSAMMIGKSKGLTKLTIPMTVRAQSDTGIPLLPPAVNTQFSSTLPQVVGKDYAANSSPTSVADLYPPFPTEFHMQEGVETFHPVADNWPFIYSHNQPQQPPQFQVQHQQPVTHLQQNHHHHQHQQQQPHQPQPQQHQQPALHQSMSWPSLHTAEQQATTTHTTTTTTTIGVTSSFEYFEYSTTNAASQEQPEDDFYDVDLSYSLMEQGSDTLDGSTGYVSDQSASYDDAIGIWKELGDDEEHLTKRLRSDGSDSSGETSTLSLTMSLGDDDVFDDMIDQLLELDEADLEDTNRPLLCF